MVLCLAQQLAEQLQAFADLLMPLVTQHKDAISNMSLADTFRL